MNPARFKKPAEKHCPAGLVAFLAGLPGSLEMVDQREHNLWRAHLVRRVMVKSSPGKTSSLLGDPILNSGPGHGL